MDSYENKKYLMYYLRAMAYRDVFIGLSTGVRVRSCDLRWNKLSVFPFIVPSKKEQDGIVHYLDNKIVEINNLIIEAKAAVEDYKALKQSIITQAVTKGINSNTEMIDSGIPQVGLIPKHYQIASIRWLLSLLTDYTANGSFGDLAKNVNYLDAPDYARLVRLTDLRVNFENDGVYVNEHAYSYLRKSSLYGGEILLANVGAYAGLAVEMPHVSFRATLGPNMFLIKTDTTKWDQHFAFYSLNGNYSRTQLIMRANNTTAQPKLNKDDLKATKVILPPISEQIKISAYLDNVCPKLDGLISEKEKLISDLENYKKSIIYETVTGKRKVM